MTSSGALRRYTSKWSTIKIKCCNLETKQGAKNISSKKPPETLHIRGWQNRSCENIRQTVMFSFGVKTLQWLL